MRPDCTAANERSVSVHYERERLRAAMKSGMLTLEGKQRYSQRACLLPLPTADALQSSTQLVSWLVANVLTMVVLLVPPMPMMRAPLQFSGVDVG